MRREIGYHQIHKMKELEWYIFIAQYWQTTAQVLKIVNRKRMVALG
jgi:hypothetical protein